MNTEQFESRKRDHIQHALSLSNQASGLSGLARIHLLHEALPDLDFEEIRLDSTWMGVPTQTPFYVAGITAGHPDAPKINRNLALACAEHGWVMGVGSQRRDLESLTPAGKGSHSTIDHWRQLRREVPDLILFANLGISQLISAPLEKIQEVIELIDAQALAVHLNPLQEALQPEGTPQFKGALEALLRVAGGISVPVILKETGCGFSQSTLQKIQGIQGALGGGRLAAIDVSGLGGTHWGRIEGARAQQGSLQSAAAITFAEWGESTVDSVRAAKAVLKEIEIWASGGVRSGLDAAKLIALGAHRVGYAKPALEAALESADAVKGWMSLQEYELKVALFCTGTQSPAALREKENAWKPSAL
jgi:isopentenyl-diphosphate delta-isomerase